MLTIEKLKEEATLLPSGYCYEIADFFPEYGGACDIYFMSKQSEMTQLHVDVLNTFIQEYKKRFFEIERYIC